MILEHPDGRWTLVPRHDPIKIGTMKSIIEDVGITTEDFVKLL
jgi:predicted RNA binding protein YcfA (HicA-like mRNA interferase family)